ncbi:hypothetical protein [Stutzerimonas stutzeri]|uniref:hypothetical protein n=1 Tax=Stutzerimonas stutzeri TaxID=316 RepID=UPI001BCF45CF|nr:hypothetical protein [Stutzerimonas stutzeri]
MSVTKIIAAAIAASGIAGAFYFMQEPDAEQIKREIVDSFQAEPEAFDLEGAVQRLAAIRIEGEYEICATTAEITGQQYVEISGLVDQYQSQIKGLKLALNSALSGEGISDCDYRVLMLVINDHRLTARAGSSVGSPAAPIPADRT